MAESEPLSVKIADNGHSMDMAARGQKASWMEAGILMLLIFWRDNFENNIQRLALFQNKKVCDKLKTSKYFFNQVLSNSFSQIVRQLFWFIIFTIYCCDSEKLLAITMLLRTIDKL